MFRLSHISDVHLGPLPAVTYRDLASKRVTGYVNWQRNRRKFLHDNVLDALLEDMRLSAADHLAITGDLVNLALDIEIEMAKQWLQTLGDPNAVSVVPGNHDAYVPGAFDKACRAWGAWMTDDVTGPPTARAAFPYVRVRGPVALIGTTSARATAPFMATGFFRDAQAKRLAAVLEETGRQGLFRVVMIHHPPVRNAVPQHKRLFGIGKFQNAIQRNGAELVLHGHSHLPTLYWIAGKGKQVPVVGVAAAGQSPGGSKPPSQYNLFDVSGEPGDWRVRLTRRGLTGAATPPADFVSLDLVPEVGTVAVFDRP